MSDFEVPEPILNSPYDEPKLHWLINVGETPEQKDGRRRAGYFYRDPKAPATNTEHQYPGSCLVLTGLAWKVGFDANYDALVLDFHG